METWNAHHFLRKIEKKMNKMKENISSFTNNDNNNENIVLLNYGLSLRSVNHFFTKSPLPSNKKNNTNDKTKKVVKKMKA